MNNFKQILERQIETFEYDKKVLEKFISENPQAISTAIAENRLEKINTEILSLTLKLKEHEKASKDDSSCIVIPIRRCM